MFVLKGKFLEVTSYTNKEGKRVDQAVIYSSGDGQTYRLTGFNVSNLKPFDDVSVPVRVGVYNGQLFVNCLN